MSPPNVADQFGDTTYTKVFVGGLAWETQRDTMRKYFEQFGEILEAVVIIDKKTGRSKGYGFVTFREAEAALKACVDPSPVIDGRRANCNLASLGVQKTRPTTPLHGRGSRNFRVTKSFPGSLQGGMGTAFPSPATFPHYAIPQGLPYYFYGFSPYSADYNYPAADYQSYYNMYGGAIAQYPLYGGAATAMVNETASSYYPYSFHFGQVGNGGSAAAPTTGQGRGYDVQIQYPQMFHYSALNTTSGMTGFATQLYGGPMSITPNSTTQTGMTMALTAPTLPNPVTNPYRLIPSHLTTTSTPEQSLA